MFRVLALLLSIFIVTACGDANKKESTPDTTFKWEVDRFADVRILRYQIPDFDKLSLDQKKLVYYLTQAGLEGRDIMYDMNNRHNLEIRSTLEKLLTSYKGDKSTDEWKSFDEYLKRIWFSNGIHHHYSMDKFSPSFSKSYLNEALSNAGLSMSDGAMKAIFDPGYQNKKVNLDTQKGLISGSAVNFYGDGITAQDVEDFYKLKKNPSPDKPYSHGLNSRLIRNSDGELEEQVYSANGRYGGAIKRIMGWLEKASGVAENESQRKALDLLVEYYRTGDLKTWDDYNVAWVEATEGDIDYINSFIEVYNDPLGYKGSYESIVEIKDFSASEQMEVLSKNAQWFEDNSTIADKHKKENVVGISYKVVNVAGESGDASPSTPIGVNLPNANWIRATHGSKSVSLGNIINASNQASGSSMLKEFAHDDEEVARGKEHGELADKLSTALHEVIGHASGKIEPGVGTPKETLKNYASTLEEARADIVALYFILDQKIVDIGLMSSLDVAKAEYDGFISNGLMKQLRRIELGKDIEESHMRNRQLIAKWVYEKGRRENVIEKVVKEEKTYYNITDYDMLRGIFGDLLKEIQRIKSQGDYEAGRDLVENYGVKVDRELHAEVLERTKNLSTPPYSGFVNPELMPVTNEDGDVTDIEVTYPDDFTTQMLKYAKEYSGL